MCQYILCISTSAKWLVIVNKVTGSAMMCNAPSLFGVSGGEITCLVTSPGGPYLFWAITISTYHGHEHYRKCAPSLVGNVGYPISLVIKYVFLQN